MAALGVKALKQMARWDYFGFSLARRIDALAGALGNIELADAFAIALDTANLPIRPSEIL